ncbi:unnamed protein product [Trichogramma brassicae]|uniref:Uncharacterized protein n=1 Tax=Trichogramma brassicae TaxID=86971 RepID=A0A6H5I245_9HYME|nr:unnamed protein product [Trichogramma brassicae]
MSQIFGVGAEGRIRASPVLPRGVYHLRRQALDLARSKRLPRPFMRGLKIFMRLAPASGLFIYARRTLTVCGRRDGGGRPASLQGPFLTWPWRDAVFCVISSGRPGRPLSAPRPASRRKPLGSHRRSEASSVSAIASTALFRRGGSSAAAYKELRSRVRNLLGHGKESAPRLTHRGGRRLQSRWRALRSMGVSSPRLPSPLTSFSADELCSHYVAVGSRAPPLDISMATAAVPAERRTVFDF